MFMTVNRPVLAKLAIKRREDDQHNSLLTYRRILKDSNEAPAVRDGSPRHASPKIRRSSCTEMSAQPNKETDDDYESFGNENIKIRSRSKSLFAAPNRNVDKPSNDQGAIQAISEIYSDMLKERDSLQQQHAQLEQRKKSISKELIILEESIKQLEQKKKLLHSEFIDCELKQETLAPQLTELLEKLKRLDQTSSEFERHFENIKSNNCKTPFVPPIAIPSSNQVNTPRSSRIICRRAFDDPFDISDSTFTGHTGSILSLNLVSSRYAITSSSDKSIKVWDMDATSRCLHTLNGHTGWVHSIVSDMGLHQNIDLDFVDDYIKQLPPTPTDDDASSTRSGDSTSESIDHFDELCPFIISGGGDSTVRIWDLRQRRNHGQPNCQILNGHTAGVLVVRCDQSTIISGSVDHTIKLWDRETGKCTQTLTGNDSYVKTLQFLSYALISGGGDGLMRLWDLRSGKYFRTIDAHDEGLNVLQFDTEKIVSGGRDGRVRIFELGTGKVLDALSVGSPITSLQFYKDKLIFAASRIAPVMYNIKSRTTIREFVGHTDKISDLQFNRKRLITASWDKSMKLWSLEQ